MKFLESMQHIKNDVDSFSLHLSCSSCSYLSLQEILWETENRKTSIFKVFAFLRVLNANSPSIYWASTHVLGDANEIQSSVFLKGMTWFILI